MKQLASIMYLYPGMVEEYKRRHDHLWTEMKETLKKYGVSNYSIFVNKETNQLFSYLEVIDEKQYKEIGKDPICQKWWEYMDPLMETKNTIPVSVELEKLFYLE